MFRQCLSYFYKKPDAAEVKTALLELSAIRYSNDTLSVLESKLSAISACVKQYLKNRNCLVITLDALLSVLSGASSTGLGFLIYNSPPSSKLIECLNLVNTTITDYCQKEIHNRCNEIDSEYCDNNLTTAVLVPSAMLFFCAAGIYLLHVNLKKFSMEKHKALEEHLLGQLDADEKAILERLGIKGNSSEMLEQLQSYRSEDLLDHSEGLLESRPRSPGG